MKIINWGIIGCGDVTEVKSGPGFQKAKNSNLLAVMRRNGELAQDYAKRHGVPKWYDKAEDLISDPDITAIYIATPPSTHMVYALQSIEAGKPVYIEKPMGLTYDDCNVVLAAGKKYNVPVYVAYYRRALPYFLKIKELLDKNLIGDVRSVTVTQFQKRVSTDPANLPWRLNPEISGGGLFHDVGCHTLDVLDMLLGPITSSKGHGSNQGNLSPADDTVSLSFSFENGVLGTGLWCFDANENREWNEIIGTHGKIKFTTFAFDPIELHTSKGVESFTLNPPQHIQQPLIQTIVDDLLGLGTALSTAETAIRTTQVMDTIQ
ncbi:MAG TPA: Gfo/Idh/MocA family oxidoreductase [Epulopiscium sp.]|nr:Gfo/Idh/MocA family oxidoreductase [Candidatus Epulonipiscium sp.]